MKDNRVRATGATPILAWFIGLFKKNKANHKVTCKTCGGIFYTKDIKVTECYGCEVLRKGF